MTTTKPFPLGSVSTGTLRTEDLLPAFTDALTQLAPYSQLIPRANKLMQEPGEWADGEEVEYLVNEEMPDELHSLCPPFVYFGAHPGDGADFGFWPDHDAIDDACQYDTWEGGNTDEGRPDEYQVDDSIIQIDGHGNVTVMDLDRQVIWSTA